MDPFVNDSYANLPYKTNACFSYSNLLNHAQASEVSVNMLCIQLVLTKFSVAFITFKLCLV